MMEDKKTVDFEDNEFDSKTMLQIFFSQFAEHKMAVAGLLTIIFFVIVALMAPVIARVSGIDPDAQNVFNRYKPVMSTIVAPADVQEIAVEKFLEKEPDLANDVSREMKSQGIVDQDVDDGDVFFEFLSNYDFDERSSVIEKLKSAGAQRLIDINDGFQTTHILGTDELGRDVLLRLIYGARVSIGVGLLVAFASAIIGLLIGSLAGYYGGIIDGVLMRVTDSLLALPLLPLLIVFAAVDLSKVPVVNLFIGDEGESVTKLVVILCIFSWMTVARLVRGSILSVKEQEFVLAARTLGAKDRTIILSHIVPNVLAPLLVAVTLKIGEAILSEAALSFLGLGIQPPTPSWGNMLFNAQEIITKAPLLAIVPGLCILVSVVSFNFFGDGIQDAIDPKSIRR